MTQPKQTKRRVSPEFKLEAIEQVVKYQRSTIEVARALELDPSQLRNMSVPDTSIIDVPLATGRAI
ncbi:transposase [Yersinia ruckeri]|nr:transposase [Yersinia ruckeri]